MSEKHPKMDDMVCPVCRKKFIPAGLHAYRSQTGNKSLVCSYHCMRATEKKGWRKSEARKEANRPAM